MKGTNNNYTKKIILKEGIKEMLCEDVCIKFENLIYKMAHKYKNCGEFEDSLQIAYIGLIKAYNHYNYIKGILFITYTVRIIENEFLQILRKNKRLLLTTSLQYEFKDNLELLDMIDEAINYEENTLNKVIIKKVINNLTDIDKKIIFLRMKGLNQNDISKRVGTSQANISRRLKRICNEIKEEIN